MSFDPYFFSKSFPLYNSTIINSEYNEEGLFNTYNENELNNSLLLEGEGEGPTNYQTDFLNFEKKKQLPKVTVCTFESIKKIFEKNYIDFEQILNNLIYDEVIEEVENKYLGKKIKRSYNSTTNIERQKYRKGRKKNDDISQRSHNKNSSDNIIKKIKSKCFENILQFINNILNQINNNIDEKKKILKDIDYKYINKLKKEFDLNLLNTSIKDLLSFEVSGKFHCDVEFNKKLIKELMETKYDNKFLMFVLNMTFREWLDLFTLKKDIKEFNKTFSEELFKNMTNVKNMIEGVYNKNNDRNYISSFIFYLYNYENWFSMRTFKKKRN
jgi:hypothetical protein